MTSRTELLRARNKLKPMIALLRRPFLLLALIFLIPYVIAHLDPYKIIGVQRDASLDQIKRAYREQAKRLHPDTSTLSKDEASRKFIELNKAFAILKDPRKRAQFSRDGEFDNVQDSRGSESRRTHHGTGFWFANGFRVFNTDSQFRRQSINSQRFYHELMNESKTKPYLIFFYSDFCPSCRMIEEAWFKITNELAKYNIGSFTINVHHENQLSRDLGIDSIPHIACLLDGRVKSYRQREFTFVSIGKFVKNLLPSNLFKLLRSVSDQDRFIAFSPKYNRLSAILFHGADDLSLGHQMIAYELRSYYKFGLVNTRYSDYEAFAIRYNITTNLQLGQSNLLIFDENIKKPRLIINMKPGQIDLDEVKSKLLRWPFIKLPRISSQSIFDDLCVFMIPRESSKPTKKLCIILFASDLSSSQRMRDKLIEFINQNDLEQDAEALFSYIDPAKQKDFVKALLSETKFNNVVKVDENIESKIIIIERNPHDHRKALYKWLSSNWDPDSPDDLDRAKLELYGVVRDYKQGKSVLQSKLALTMLIDEDGHGLLENMMRRLMSYISNLIEYLSSSESIFTIVIIVCACMTCVFLFQPQISSLPNTEDIFPPKGCDGYQQPTRQNATHDIEPACDDLKLIELKAETYYGMVLMLKPGCRSIVLLTDRENNDRLLSKFKRAVWPYRRNKTLLFGYLCLDKNLDWYKSLWEEILGVALEDLNKKNCIGTVLSLNGFKKYIRVYHTKHHEIDHYDDETENDGAFLGFYDIESRVSEQNESVHTADNLLDKLPIWLDKTFDGITRKYFLSEWPINIK